MHVYFVVFTGGRLYILDLAAKIDQCAEYLCKSLWGDLEFPPPFGRDALPEVSYRCMAGTSIKIHIRKLFISSQNDAFSLPQHEQVQSYHGIRNRYYDIEKKISLGSVHC